MIESLLLLVIGEQIAKMVLCYAPQAGRSQIEKDKFRRQVEGVIMNTGINQRGYYRWRYEWSCRSGSQWIS